MKSAISRVELYDLIMDLLDDIKLSRGPRDVQITLKKHPKVANFIDSCHRMMISEYEDAIDLIS